MQLRKVKFKKSNQVKILCGDCYRKLLDDLREIHDTWEIFNTTSPSLGILAIVGYWDTAWSVKFGLMLDKNFNSDEWVCNDCRQHQLAHKKPLRQLELF